jgi:hypothetical protein
MRDTTSNITRGGNRKVALLKFPRLCPLVLPVNVSWRQDERGGESEGDLKEIKKNRKILFRPILFDIRRKITFFEDYQASTANPGA